MWPRPAVGTVLVALLCAGHVAGRHLVEARQDSSNGAATTTTGSGSISSSAIASASPSSSFQSANSDNATSSSDGVTSSHLAVTATSAPNATLAITTSSPTSSVGSAPSAAPRGDALPIKPKITPAIGVTGAVLIITGTVLCFIGIKHRWLHVCLSAAFLTSLAVTVLILYVMNPPVSDTIQGAYFAAAAATGLVFGSISLVFKDVAEGLGCLLGGFCLSMWFLVLAPGGLVHSTSGRAILIAVFSTAAFSLYFSRYTRNYGLIACTAFSGAMITVIGVDCFSRAGLKEFWIYIWNLNSNEFPINTNTYPVTRGIRVEIAGTTILFLFGVMSQMKIWQIVKKRRAKREEERIRDDESRDQLASAVGKDIEARNRRERAQWEAMYGEKTEMGAHGDSSLASPIASFAKASSSSRELEVDCIEPAGPVGSIALQEIKGRGERGPLLLQGASEEDVLSMRQIEANLLDQAREPRQYGLHRASHVTSIRTSVLSDESTLAKEFAHHGSSINPLQSSLPGEGAGDFAVSQNRHVMSTGTVGDPRDMRDDRMEHLSPNEDPKDTILSGQHVDDDGNSSVAATMDAENDVPSSHLLGLEDGRQHLFNEDLETSYILRGGPAGAPVEERDEEELVRPDSGAVHGLTNAVARQTDGTNRLGKGNGSDVGGQTAGFMADHLPQQLSKVAMTYRTNEWAKHIAEADVPEAEEALEPHSPGVQVDTAFAEEAAKPVDISALSETTPVAQGVDASRSAPQIPQSNGRWRNSKSRPTTLSRMSSGEPATPVHAFAHTGSWTTVVRQESQANHPRQPKVRPTAIRRSPAPLASQVESAADDTVAATADTDGNGSSQIKRHAFVQHQQPAHQQDERAQAPNFSNRSKSPALGNTLASHRSSQPFQMDGLRPQLTKHDSYQPIQNPPIDLMNQNASGAPRRQSTPIEALTSQPLLARDVTYEALTSQRRRSGRAPRGEENTGVKRGSLRDQAMWRSALNEAHRDALRRMQAEANEHV